MKRIIISITILSALVILSVVFSISTAKGCDRLVEIINDIQANEDSHDAERLEKEWSNFSHKVRIFIRFEKFKEAGLKISRISSLIEAGSDELNADLEELAEIIHGIRENEIPSLKSIF